MTLYVKDLCLSHLCKFCCQLVRTVASQKEGETNSLLIYQYVNIKALYIHRRSYLYRIGMYQYIKFLIGFIYCIFDTLHSYIAMIIKHTFPCEFTLEITKYLIFVLLPLLILFPLKDHPNKSKHINILSIVCHCCYHKTQ